jgi:hypothetical protein
VLIDINRHATTMVRKTEILLRKPFFMMAPQKDVHITSTFSNKLIVKT